MTEYQLADRTDLRLPEPLRWVESTARYSVYREPSGREVYLAHGTAQRLVYLDELDLNAEWRTWQLGSMWTQDWEDFLRGRLVDEDEADEVSRCGDCSEPDFHDEMYRTGHDVLVCTSCWTRNYWLCGGCSERFRSTTTIAGGGERCEGCIENGYTYCEDCEGYYPDEEDHSHPNGDGCCESPAQVFGVRNDGEGILLNDVRTTVTLPAGIISDEGIEAIRGYLRNQSYYLEQPQREHLWTVAYSIDEIGTQWQTKQGNFTKRLSRFAYKSYGLKLDPGWISQVGCIARDHSTAVEHAIEVTRDLNLPPEDFAHEDSCWWQSYYESRCALKTNGGFGLRTFLVHEDWTEVNGRAWVLPLKLDEHGRLEPTFETEDPAGFVVFNGYGSLGGYTPARIVAHMAGMTYRKIGFSAAPMYVNNDAGYLIAPEEIAENYTDGSLTLRLSQHSTLFEVEQEAKTLEMAHV